MIVLRGLPGFCGQLDLLDRWPAICIYTQYRPANQGTGENMEPFGWGMHFLILERRPKAFSVSRLPVVDTVKRVPDAVRRPLFDDFNLLLSNKH